MNHYIDVLIRDTAEFPISVVLNSIFAKLHLALVKFGRGRVGVSFPNVGLTLGNTLRLHGSLVDLSSIVADTWLQGFLDYVTVTLPLEVPSTCRYCVVRRIQVKSSPERLIRRSLRNGRISEAEAVVKMSKVKAAQTAVPYIQLRSMSSGHSFKLFIKHGEPTHAPRSGTFSSYGLSDSATVPWF